MGVGRSDAKDRIIRGLEQKERLGDAVTESMEMNILGVLRGEGRREGREGGREGEDTGAWWPE